ncbi:hypothetical protein ACFOSC_12550 [Streptantibioticus rubrisoli]|uniref:Uncharacterized protein n=1 Tax=Streptantibioticus rubrisoli TaxID=1387313 RepID=A0ABT1P838_9ACTN|nr:hypothetical protein [Streptantibioticus rubrisoli]MCQ4041541.1 hypothetical protein [Streptantibioticus rubrisoli]
MSATPPETAPPVPWRDTKRRLWPLGLLTTFLPFLGGLGAATGLGGYGWWAPQAGLLLVPVLDWRVGADRCVGPPRDRAAELQRDPYYRRCL